MNTRTIVKNLFQTSIPALLAYFSILLIGDSLARSEKKTDKTAASSTVSARIPTGRSYTILPGSLLTDKNK
jgi:hypothetical protein